VIHSKMASVSQQITYFQDVSTIKMSVWLTTANSLLEKLGFGCVGCNNLLVQ
jgi:hypothetical protein